MTDTALDWTQQLVEQLHWHWSNQLRPRLEGLTDEEYHWPPSPGLSWGIHRVGEGITDFGTGEFRCDFAFPEPSPPPVTTIAWRLAHLIVGVFGMRAASHFGAAATDYGSHPYAGTATEALRQLDETYGTWLAGVRGLDGRALAAACGPAEGPYAQEPMATLVLHISREAIHHGAEISLLRDLYRARADQDRR